MRWLDLIKTFAPLVLALVPKLPPTIVPLIVHGIEIAEIRGGTGVEKRAQVLDATVTGMDIANQIAGKIILDPQELSTVVGRAIDTAVDAVNVVHKAQLSAT